MNTTIPSHETASAPSASSARPELKVQPYLFFDGRCEEALEFYQRALGAQLTALLRFRDNPDGPNAATCAEGMEKVSGEKVMHASFRIGETEIMASDGPCSGAPNFQGVSLSIAVRDAEEADRFFHALAVGGKVQMPIGRTFFSPRFGMVADRFGLSWMIVTVPGPQP